MIARKMGQYGLILALAAVMLTFVLLALWMSPEQTLLERVTFLDPATGFNLRPFYDEVEDEYILFLPPHSEEKSIKIQLPGSAVTVQSEEGASLDNAWSSLPSGEKLTLTARSLFRTEKQVFELRHCTGLPSLFLEAEEGALAYIHEEKGNQGNVLAMLTDEGGNLIFSQAAVITGRGNSSWDGQDKRPYELRFDSGVTFGPFLDISKLCLLAEHSDESKLRNSLVYYGAKQMGIPYASGYQYVNLYFAGEYLGLYGIVTKEEYKKHILTDEIQAVFEVTSNLERQDFRPALGRNPVRVLYGNVQTVCNAVDAFENGLLNGDWQVCEKAIDANSFARKLLTEELFANSDVTFASQYYYLDKDGKIHCMLPWDYDLSLGYAFRYFNNKQVYEIECYKDLNGWYSMLTAHPQFRQRILDALGELCTQDFVESLEHHLQESVEEIRVSRECDIRRWENAKPFNWFDLSCGEETLDAMARLYADYIPERIAFLKDHFSRWEDYCLVAFDGKQYGNLCIPKGDNLWDYLEGANILPGEKIDSGFQGWFTEDGCQPEDITILTEDIRFTARTDASG